jgi:hypothetical protein
MRAVAFPQSFVMAIYPTTHGFGWAVLENPLSLVGHGVFTEYRNQRERCIEQADRLLGHFRPEAVVFPTTDPNETRHGSRSHDLSKALRGIAKDQGADVVVLSREAVLRVFAAEGAITRAEIASAVAARLPALYLRLPKPRRFDDGAAKSLAMYDAAALVLTFYENGATALLDDLRDTA